MRRRGEACSGGTAARLVEHDKARLATRIPAPAVSPAVPGLTRAVTGTYYHKEMTRCRAGEGG